MYTTAINISQQSLVRRHASVPSMVRDVDRPYDDGSLLLPAMTFLSVPVIFCNESIACVLSFFVHPSNTMSSSFIQSRQKELLARKWNKMVNIIRFFDCCCCYCVMASSIPKNSKNPLEDGEEVVIRNSFLEWPNLFMSFP